MPIGSIVLQFNEWRVGDTQTTFLQIEKRNRYTEKNIYYLTPAGKIGHLYVKGGLMGVHWGDFMVEKNQTQEWLKQLDEWKRNKHD